MISPVRHEKPINKANEIQDTGTTLQFERCTDVEHCKRSFDQDPLMSSIF